MMVGALLISDHPINKNSGDAVDYFYGVKIDTQWYFFSGPTVVLPREAYQKDIHAPLSFTKLHEIAMDEIFNGYLTKDGEINEEFFSRFKKDAYGYPNKTQEQLEKSYISYCKENWVQKYAPYKKEDITFIYNKDKKEATVSFTLQTPDSVYLEPKGYKILFKHPGIDYIDCTCYNWCAETVNWKKNKVAQGIIKNLAADSEVEIYLEELLAVNGRTPRMGPFVFNTTDKTDIARNTIKKNK